MADANDMIFLLSDDQVLQRVPVAHYESEDLLQRLIESCPERARAVVPAVDRRHGLSSLASTFKGPAVEKRWLPLRR